MKSADFSRNSFIYSLLFVVLLTLKWNTLNLPLERDEGEYFYCAKLFLEGLPIYKNAFMQKPPVIVYIYIVASIFKIQSILAVRIFALISIFISAIIAGQWFHRFHPQSSKFIAPLTIISLLSLPVPYLWLNAANTELFLLPLLTYLLYASGKPSYEDHLLWLAKGIIAGLSVMIKPIVIPLIGAIFIYDIIVKRRFEYKAKELIKYAFYYGSGFVSAMLILLIPVFFRNDFMFFFESVIEYNWYYKDAYQNSSAFKSNLFFYLKIFGPILLVAFFGVILNFKKLLPYVIIFTITLFSISSAQIPRYYVILFPILVIFFSVGISKMANINRVRKPLEWLISIVLIIMTLSPYRLHFIENQKELSAFLYPGHCSLKSKEIGQLLANKALPNEAIYIAGSEPQIHYYANTRNLGRFITKYPLMLSTKLDLIYQKEDLKRLTQNLPRLIIVAQHNESWLRNKNTPQLYFDELQKIISNNYSQVKMKQPIPRINPENCYKIFLLDH